MQARAPEWLKTLEVARQLLHDSPLPCTAVKVDRCVMARRSAGNGAGLGSPSAAATRGFVQQADILYRLIKPIASFIVKRRSAKNMRNKVPKARRPRAKAEAGETETDADEVEGEFEAPPEEDEEDETESEE